MGCPLRTAVAKLVFVTRCGPDRGQLQFDICVIEWDRHTAKVHSTATQHSWSAAAFLCHSDTSNKFDWQATSIADRGTALFVVAEEHSFAKASHELEVVLVHHEAKHFQDDACTTVVILVQR